MSVTVSATPIMLLAGAIQALHETVQKSLNSAKHSNIEFESLNYKLKKLLEENNGQLSEEIVQTVCQEFDTIFLDKNLLIKTLEEHGTSDLETEGDTIRCKLECFVLEFDKVNSNNSTSENIYKMKIFTKCDENQLEQMLTDINEEYALNTQEETYIKIKERLEKQGLKIDEEEVLDDNSIVLTVNIN